MQIQKLEILKKIHRLKMALKYEKLENFQKKQSF